MDKTISTTYRRFLHLKAIAKYGIFGLAFISLAYCILTWLGYYVPWMFIIFFSFAFILRMVLSKAFGLCWIHRSCILYNYCVSLIIVTKPETFFGIVGIEKQMMVGVMAVIGLIIFSLILWKIRTKKSC